MGEIDLSGESPFVDISISAVRWPQGKRAPADSPPCGFDGELCVSTTPKLRTNNNDSDIGGFESDCFFCLVFQQILQPYNKLTFNCRKQCLNSRLLWKVEIAVCVYKNCISFFFIFAFEFPVRHHS